MITKTEVLLYFFLICAPNFPAPTCLISFFIIFSEVIGTGTVGVVSFPTERKSSKFEENLKKKAVYGHVLGFDRSKNTFFGCFKLSFFFDRGPTDLELTGHYTGQKDNCVSAWLAGFLIACWVVQASSRKQQHTTITRRYYTSI